MNLLSELFLGFLFGDYLWCCFQVVHQSIVFEFMEFLQKSHKNPGKALGDVPVGTLDTFWKNIRN